MDRKIVDDLVTETRSVEWLIEKFRDERIIIDNTFQRRFVWTKSDRIKLIETIMLGFSIPEIYLWQTEIDSNTGRSIYSLIDGQQRIRSVLNFIENEITLDTSVYELSQFKKKYFKELSTDEKKAIWRYKFTVRFLYNPEVERKQIIKMFLRLNSTDKTLNPQEKRNAQFDGLFLRLAEDLSDLPFWEKYSIFTKSQMRRMLDIQFVSRILIFLRFGIDESLTQKKINEVYDQYNDDYEFYDADKQTTIKMIEIIQNILGDRNLLVEIFCKTAHLYILFIMAYTFIKQDIIIDESVVSRFLAFANYYQNEISIPEISLDDEKRINEYKELSQGGLQMRARRIRRYKLFKEVFSDILNVSDN